MHVYYFQFFFFFQIAKTPSPNCLDLLKKQNFQVFLSAVEHQEKITEMLKEL